MIAWPITHVICSTCTTTPPLPPPTRTLWTVTDWHIIPVYSWPFMSHVICYTCTTTPPTRTLWTVTDWHIIPVYSWPFMSHVICYTCTTTPPPPYQDTVDSDRLTHHSCLQLTFHVTCDMSHLYNNPSPLPPRHRTMADWYTQLTFHVHSMTPDTRYRSCL